MRKRLTPAWPASQPITTQNCRVRAGGKGGGGHNQNKFMCCEQVRMHACKRDHTRGHFHGRPHAHYHRNKMHAHYVLLYCSSPLFRFALVFVFFFFCFDIFSPETFMTYVEGTQPHEIPSSFASQHDAGLIKKCNNATAKQELIFRSPREFHCCSLRQFHYLRQLGCRQTAEGP